MRGYHNLHADHPDQRSISLYLLILSFQGSTSQRFMEDKKKHDQVSTVLCLWDPTWPTCSTNHNKKRKARDHDDDDQLASTASSSSKQRGEVLVSPMPPALLELFPPSVTPSVNHKIIINGNGTATNKNIMTMMNTTHKQQQQLNRIHPKMLAAHLNRINAWGIEKTLTARDLHTHLHLPANSMASHVMSYVDDKFKRGVLESRVGAQVIVHDCDTGSTHLQSIVRVRHVPGTASSYVFAGLKWLPGFVKRRNLRVGDRIGLHWLRKLPKPVFLFSVVQRASPQSTTPPHQALPILIDCY